MNYSLASCLLLLKVENVKHTKLELSNYDEETTNKTVRR